MRLQAGTAATAIRSAQLVGAFIAVNHFGWKVLPFLVLMLFHVWVEK